MKLIVREPSSKEDFEKYYDLRWRILRKPWNQPKGSEMDDLEESAIHIMICDEHNKLLGAGRVHFTSSGEAQLRYMAVEEGMQGKGVGTALLHELEKKAVTENVKKIILNARENAVDFYRKSGYRIVSPSHTLYGVIKHFLMEKDIDQS